MYEEGHYLAVLSPEGSFYICQALQDIPYKGKRKYTVKWLEEHITSEFTKTDTEDVIQPQCIIDEVILTKVNRYKYLLSDKERKRIMILLEESKTLRTNKKLKRAHGNKAVLEDEPNIIKKCLTENYVEKDVQINKNENQSLTTLETDDSCKVTEVRDNESACFDLPEQCGTAAVEHTTTMHNIFIPRLCDNIEELSKKKGAEPTVFIGSKDKMTTTYSSAAKGRKKKKNKNQDLTTLETEDTCKMTEVRDNESACFDLPEECGTAAVEHTTAVQNICIPELCDNIDELTNKKGTDATVFIGSKTKVTTTHSSAAKGRKKKKILTDCFSDSNEETDLDEIAIKQSQFHPENGKRKYDKRHVCYFCHKTVNKMSRHLQLIHKDEMAVQEILAQPKKSQSRKEKFAHLTRIGDYYHNCDVLSCKRGELILVRRPTTEEAVNLSFSDYSPCPNCLGFMLQKHLWSHIKYNCPERKKKAIDITNKKGILSESRALISTFHSSEYSLDFMEGIVYSFKANNKISKVCREDGLILKFGAFLHEKYGNTQNDLVRQCMRQCARLLQKVKEYSSEIKTLSQCLVPNNFDILIRSTKSLCGENFESRERPTFGVPSLALKLGHHLRKCASIERGIALRKNNLAKDQELQAFLYLMGLEWTQRISSCALSTLSRRKLNTTDLLPLTSDLVKLNEYLTTSIDNRIEDFERSKFDRTTWTSLAELALSRIIIFNKRRSGEASKITMQQFQNRPNWTDVGSQEIKNSLTPLELKLSARLSLIDVVGKRGRKVSIILTPDTKKAIDTLLKFRSNFPQLKNNTYLFPQFGTENNMRGHICLKSVCTAANLEKPELITSTRLRKYIATVTQIFNLTENECDWLARHLGHDIRVHREFYRLQESAVELTKISRLLIVVDEGKASQFSGKPLSEIELADLPPISDDEEENDDNDLQDLEESPFNKKPQVSTSKPSTMCNEIKTRGSGKNVKKQQWLPQEKRIILTYFRKHIKSRITPGKEECLKLMAENPTFFVKRTWKDIKWQVYNHQKSITSKYKLTSNI